ncbi:MAG: helix-turn-helix transcriptional regulator [Clostridia bacterium]|nr:helix-turn-helix transcriptional regulator [Clostridia bacterium]
MKIFRERLRDLRKNADLTQKQLADILQTNNSSVCDWECGRSQPDLETLAVIACFFDVSTDYLLGLEDESGCKIKYNVHHLKDKAILIKER